MGYRPPMTEPPTSRDDRPPPPLPAGSAPDDYIDGLALDRLHRSGVITFLQGLVRRASTTFAEPSDDRSSDEQEQDLDAEWIEGVRGTLSDMADRLEALIERLEGVGYPLDPNAPGADDDRPAGLPAELAAAWRRFATATTEALRRSDGIPSDEWADENLVAHGRAAVGELGWLLRVLEDRVSENS